MSSGREPDWWSIVKKILTGDAWTPFIRVMLFLLFLAVFTIAILLVLGPTFAMLFAGTGVISGVARVIKRHRKVPNV